MSSFNWKTRVYTNVHEHVKAQVFFFCTHSTPPPRTSGGTLDIPFLLGFQNFLTAPDKNAERNTRGSLIGFRLCASEGFGTGKFGRQLESVFNGFVEGRVGKNVWLNFSGCSFFGRGGGGTKERIEVELVWNRGRVTRTATTWKPWWSCVAFVRTLMRRYAWTSPSCIDRDLDQQVRPCPVSKFWRLFVRLLLRKFCHC